MITAIDNRLPETSAVLAAVLFRIHIPRCLSVEND